MATTTTEIGKATGDAGIGNVVAAHYNNLQEAGRESRKDSRIFHMRNFNNWIKSMLVGEYATKVKQKKRQLRDERREQGQQGSRDRSPSRNRLADETESFTVLDIGCGKGGDLLKWQKANVDHVVMVDIAQTSVEQAKDRYEIMKDRARNRRMFTADFFAADCTKTILDPLYPRQEVTFDIVSCQFAFHYCFESLEQADTMLANVSKRLRPGGYFIGTTPDANEIISRVRAGKASNDVYSVSFENELSQDQPPAIFGAKYNFHLEGVVDCPEFLVHFPSLIKLAEEKHGLMLIAQSKFDSCYKKWKDSEDGGPLLKRMNVVESYFRNHRGQLAGGDPDGPQYAHARQYLDNHPEVNRIDTISKDEWEAITLYLLFAFKKMK